MTTQTLIIGKRRFVLIPEKDFRRLEKAAEIAVRPQLAKDAMLELQSYRKTGKAANWKEVKRKLGL